MSCCVGEHNQTLLFVYICSLLLLNMQVGSKSKCKQTELATEIQYVQKPKRRGGYTLIPVTVPSPIASSPATPSPAKQHLDSPLSQEFGGVDDVQDAGSVVKTHSQCNVCFYINNETLVADLVVDGQTGA